MKSLLISILIGISVSVLSQEKQKQLPPEYSRLPLEDQSYRIGVKSQGIESLTSYICLEQGGILYVLPEKKNHRELFTYLEKRAISDGKYSRISSFNQWMKQYEGTFLTNASYDYTDEWEYDFSSPLNALRSYWHALSRCDAEIVLKYSDPSFVNYSEDNHKWGLLASPPVFNNDGHTKITPLLTGVCVLGGKEYTMVFHRRECPENPKSNRISFRWIFLVLIDGTYYLSDAPAASQFGNMAEAMNLGYVYPAGKYDYLVDKLKETSMPSQFYRIKGEHAGSTIGSR